MASPFNLTHREMQILRCLCDGMGNADISNALGIREDTVKKHLWNIGDKTGQSTRLEMALFALRKGLVSLNLTCGEHDAVMGDIELSRQRLEIVHQRIERDIVRSRSLIQQIIQKQKEMVV